MARSPMPMQTGSRNSPRSSRLSMTACRTLRRSKPMPCSAMAEHGIGLLLLSVRHAVIESREHRGEFLDSVCMGIGDLAIGFEIVDSGHGFGIFCPRLDERLNGFLIVAHHLGDLGPLIFLCLCDRELGMHIRDACFAAVNAVLGRGFGRDYR